MKNQLQVCKTLLHSNAGFPYVASVLAIASTALTGCSPIASTVSSVPVAMVIHGSVSGGAQAVSGSQVQLYAAGVKGTASAAQPLLPSAVRTETDGSFSIAGKYNCPSTDAQVYLVARGGSAEVPAGKQNPSLALMTALGTCGSLAAPASVSINEATTVASVWPLASYMSSSSNLGSALDDASFTQAAADALQLVKTIRDGSIDTETSDASKLRTVANSLSPCVTSNGGAAGDGGSCARLFQLSTYADGKAPTDTITAALHIAQNPTADPAAIYNLASSRGPYQPMLSSAPQDWKLTGRSTAPDAASLTGLGTSSTSDAAGSSTTVSAMVKSIVGATITKSRDVSSSVSTYYVSSSSGNDSNDGKSPATAWKTIGKLNASIALYKPGTSILLKSGDVFRDDYINLQNQVKGVNDATTLANTPLPFSGTKNAPIIIGSYGSGTNPLIDGADPLNLQWTRVGSSTTFQATVSKMPAKLFVGSASGETTQLIPQANDTGAWVANKPYNFLDMVQNGTTNFVESLLAGDGPGSKMQASFIQVNNFTPNVTTQSFAAGMSGLQNVQATPGSWYGTGNTIYAHVANGSNPGSHTVEGTFRPFGVQIISANYVTVQNLSIERTQKGGIAMGVYSTSAGDGKYFTNEYNQILNNRIWNYGDLSSTCLQQSNGCWGNSQAGILVQAYENGPQSGELLRGILISGNYVGHSDQYFGLRGGSSIAGIATIGVDGVQIQNNTIATINVSCLSMTAFGTAPNNNGDVSYNNCGNNQSNYMVNNSTGTRVHHNIAANSFGQGIQVGGDDDHIMVDHNLFYNLGKHASTIGYNGIDCNGGGSYMSFVNNTIYNVRGAAITLEVGCDHAYVANNVMGEPAGNRAYFYYWLDDQSPNATFSHNLYALDDNHRAWHGRQSYTDWVAFSGEVGSIYDNPVFVNIATSDFRLVPKTTGTRDSVSTAMTTGGTDLGANLAAPTK